VAGGSCGCQPREGELYCAAGGVGRDHGGRWIGRSGATTHESRLDSAADTNKATSSSEKNRLSTCESSGSGENKETLLNAFTELTSYQDKRVPTASSEESWHDEESSIR